MASQYYNMNEYFEDLYNKLFTKQNKKKRIRQTWCENFQRAYLKYQVRGKTPVLI